MMKSELEDIRLIIKNIQEQRFPDLDPDFLDAVLSAEITSGEDDELALRAIRAAADRVLPKSRTS